MLLEVRNVARRFGGLSVLQDICLHADRGEALGLIGPNGAGKTTLLNVIAGVHLPSSGEVLLEGRKISGLAPESLCRLGISRTFQIPRAFSRMTALDNVRVAATFGDGSRRKRDPVETAAEMLRFVEFPRSTDTPAMSLNAAELKRLDLARALASRPKLLLLDETFAGLNPKEITDLVGLLHRIRETGVGLIVVEHLMRVIMEECSRIAVLCSGEKIAEGSPEAIARDPKVIEAYLGENTPDVADHG